MTRRARPLRETASRRAILAATGTAAVGGLVSTTTAERPVTVARDRTLRPVSAELERATEQADIVLSMTAVGVEDGVERFIGGEVDVLHARRPLLSREATAADEHGVEYEVFESTVDGIVVLTGTDGWRTSLSTEELTALRESNPEGGTWAEVVPRDVASIRIGSDGTTVDSPVQSDGSAVVRGVRPHQYAIGHGGLGYYRVTPSDLTPASAVDDGTAHTPLAQLRYTYVNTDRVQHHGIASFLDLFATYAMHERKKLQPYSDPSAQFELPKA